MQKMTWVENTTPKPETHLTVPNETVRKLKGSSRKIKKGDTP